MFVDYKYAALQNSNECWCGNSGYDKYGPGDGCNLPCQGNKTQICGGANRNSVYEICKLYAIAFNENFIFNKAVDNKIIFSKVLR